MVQLGDIAAGLGQGLQFGVQANQRQQGFALQDRAVGVQEEQVALSKDSARRQQMNSLMEKSRAIIQEAVKAIGQAPDRDSAAKIVEKVRPLVLPEMQGELDALTSSTPTLGEAAVNESGAAFAGAEETTRLLESLPDEERGFVQTVLGFPPEKQDEIYRLVADIEALPPGDSLLRQALVGRLNRIINPEGTEPVRTISLDEGGNATVSTPESEGLGGELTGAQLNDVLADRGRLASTERVINDLISLTDTNPDLFGFRGSLKAVGQNVSQFLSQLGGSLGGDTGQAIVSEAQAALPKDVFDANFDPKLDEVERAESVIAFEVARNRLVEGGDDIRALGTIFTEVRNGLRLRGPGVSAERAKARLQAALKEISGARQRLDQRVIGSGAESPTEGGGGVSFPNQDRTRAAIDRILSK